MVVVVCLLCTPSSQELLETDLNPYKRVYQVPLDTDPLVWWKKYVEDFPHLVRMTRQYLTVSDTSVSPESDMLPVRFRSHRYRF